MKKLLYLLFVIVSSPCFSLDIDGAISRSANYIIEVSPNEVKLAVINIESNSDNLSDYIFNELPNYLLNNKKNLVMVDRSQLNELQKEINFQLSGEVPDDQVIKLGQRIGAQFVITGIITNFDKSLKLNIKVMNVQSSELIGSRSYEFVKDNKVNSLIRGSDINMNTPSERKKIQSEQSRIGNNFVKHLYFAYDYSWDSPFGTMFAFNRDSIGFYVNLHFGFINSRGYNTDESITYNSDFRINKDNYNSYKYDYMNETDYSRGDISIGITYPLIVPYIWPIVGVGWRFEDHYRLYRETGGYNNSHDETKWIKHNGMNNHLILSAGLYIKIKHVGITGKYQYILGKMDPHLFNVGIGYALNLD
jgi:TolB-like protein